ncbi:MAG: c-type cytochrome [Gammaproteobacteria bacterium]|nr:c-type cytochrome [Gammaproteobacteria bacterium]
MSSNEENVTSYFVLIPFIGTIALIILWVFIILGSFFASFGATEQNMMDRSAVIERLKAVETVAVKGDAVDSAAENATAPAPDAATAPTADAGEIDGSAITTATCAACHSIGLLESPKIGDKAAWEKRIQANGDMDGLVKSAIVGKGAMPARGGNAALSDAEVRAAIEFMMQ